MQFVRHSNNPLITPASSPTIGNNINGPSVIRVPEWLPNPLGRYYMYFAHHNGKYIRLAYSNSLDGPWTIYEPGTLKLSQARRFKRHIASPDVHVDHDNHQIRMYFHGVARGGRSQWTGMAFSTDGLYFKALFRALGKYYFRVFEWGGAYYALCKSWNSGVAELLRSADGVSRFEFGKTLLPGMRHCAVTVDGDELLVFFTRVGDAPERILLSRINLTGDWKDWVASEPEEVLRPELPYEGADLEIEASLSGATGRTHALRDPCIFEEEGDRHLFYSIAGEQGIAMASIKQT